jgi:hypothetical protein
MPVAAERIPDILDSYEKDPAEALRQLDQVFRSQLDGARRTDGDAVSVALRSRGAEFLVAYLLRAGELFPLILNPQALSMDDATSALKLAMMIDVGCDIAQLESLVRAPAGAEALTRLIDLSSRVRLSGRLRPILEPLLRHDNPFLSSKVELLLKRLGQVETNLHQRLKDPDPRTQADAVESLWGEDTPESREVFRRAVNSPNDRLVGNGLYGLYLLGDVSSIKTAFDLAENQSPLVRPTAIWFMGQTGDPRFLPWLVEAMGTNDNRLRSRIFQAIRQIRERRAQTVAAGKLRLHILSATLQGKRERVVRFVVAGDSSPVIRRLPATQVMFSEGSRLVQNFSMKLASSARPAGILVVCCGGAELPGNLETLLGPADRLESKALSIVGAEPELETFAAGSGTDAILFVTGSSAPEIPNASALTEKLRQAGKRVHAVWPESIGVRHSLPMDAIARGTGGLALRFRESSVASVEQAVLAALNSYELRYDAAPPTEATVPVHLQVLCHHGAGDAHSLLVRRCESNPE